MQQDFDAGFENNRNDDGLYVAFNLFPVQDEVASQKAGRPIFRDVEFVKIAAPGQKLEVVHKPVDERIRRRFARKYQDWKQRGAQDAIVGTPLSEWPAISRSQVEELAFYNVRSVEQLAAIGDAQAQRFPGGFALKAKAKDFLEKAKENAPMEAMRAELSSRDNQIESLRRQLKEQNEVLQRLDKKK